MELRRTKHEKKNRITQCPRFRELASKQPETNAAFGLRDELALLRGTLNERLENCTNSNDLMMFTPVMLDIIDRINKVVMNCHKLEYSLGEMMDKSRLAQFSDMIINLLVEAKLSQDQVSFISDRLEAEMNKKTELKE